MLRSMIDSLNPAVPTVALALAAKGMPQVEVAPRSVAAA